MNSILTTATTVTQSGEFKKQNTPGVESWSDNTPSTKGEQTDEDIKSA